jgi:mannose/fructose/N-acetylgalactosamine-specific phosphotransferase system component IIC
MMVRDPIDILVDHEVDRRQEELAQKRRRRMKPINPLWLLLLIIFPLFIVTIFVEMVTAAMLAVAIWLRNLYEWVETQLVRIP